MSTNAPTIGPLNRAPYYPGLQEGKRSSEILVTDDNRVLFLRPDDGNYLLFPTSDGNIWYEFRTERVTKMGEDYPITQGEHDFNPFSGTFLGCGEKPDIQPAWFVDFGSSKQVYRTEQEARTAMVRHKNSFGGIAGEYEPMGWYPVRSLSDEEATLLGL